MAAAQILRTSASGSVVAARAKLDLAASSSSKLSTRAAARRAATLREAKARSSAERAWCDCERDNTASSARARASLAFSSSGTMTAMRSSTSRERAAMTELDSGSCTSKPSSVRVAALSLRLASKAKAAPRTAASGSSLAAVASDVSERALQVARRGVYGRRAVRAFETLPAWLDLEGDQHVASPRLRESIDWRRINLLDAGAISALGHFDAIICRNVMIYFRDETTQAVVSCLHDALVPGGHLLIGASESLLRLGTAFTCEERRGAFFYRKANT